MYVLRSGSNSTEITQLGNDAFSEWRDDLVIVVPTAAYSTYSGHWYSYNLKLQRGYNITCNKGITATSYAPIVAQGETVTLSGTGTIPDGYAFAGYSVKDADDDDVIVTETSGVYSFTMPASDVTVAATWKGLIVLNETDGWTTLNQYGGETVNISFKRTFASGKASTVCLPFDMTAPAASVGTFATFTGVNSEMTEVTMTAVAEGTTLTAGTPYLFTPATDAEITFANTDYVVPAGGFTAAGMVDQDSWHFKGTYENLTWDDGQTVLYGLAGNAFTPTGGGTYEIGSFQRFNSGTTAAFRAYMYYGDTAPAHHAAPILPESMKVRLIAADGSTTEVKEVREVLTPEGMSVARNKDNIWYTLDGRKLNAQPTQKGLYIVNGKKVVIK